MNVRPLTVGDFDAVVALDQRLAGTTRRDWFQRRLQAALRAPERHLQLAVDDGGLAGFVLARVAGGEFGRPDAAVVIEAIGVDPGHHGHGLGRQLLDGLQGRARAREIREIVTQATWRDHGMLGFLDHAGFQLAPRHVLERPAEPRRPDEDDDADLAVDPHRIRTLTAADADALVAIDRRITGRDRGPYLRRKVDEAVAESAIVVSLVALDDAHPVGFLMARVDAGDFGRMQVAAVLDTLGVDPRFARRGYGEALLEQLLKNLGALGVERVQTEVDRASFGLLGWFYRCGFEPSERLVFHLRA